MLQYFFVFNYANFPILGLIKVFFLLLFFSSIQRDGWIIFLLIMAAIFWVYRLVKVFCNVLSYWEIRQFYIKALKIRMVSVWRILVSLIVKRHFYRIR